MAFTEFYCQSGGNQLNSGHTTNNSAAYTATNGNWDGTSIYTPTDGSIPGNSMTIGDFASVYLDGATVAVYIGRITNVAAGVNGAITISTTAKMGTAPTSGATGRSIKVGGAWKGPNGADGFPLTIIAGTLTNAAGDTTRVNFKNDATYSVTAAITATAAGPYYFQGYTTTPGDLGRAIIDGGATGTSYNIFSYIGQTVLLDFIFQNNGNSGSQYGVVGGGTGNCYVGRCVFKNMRQGGLLIGTNGNNIVEECEAFNCNLGNVGNAGAFAANISTDFIRCIAHDNTTSNAPGFSVGGTSCSFRDCIADSNGADGFLLQVATKAVMGCDSYNNGRDGIRLSSVSASLYHIENCNLIKNGGWGINGTGSGSRVGMVINCGFGTGSQANTSGTTTGLKSMLEVGSINYPNNVTPWADPANGNFTITLSNAKQVGRGTFTQTAASYGGTFSYIDIGAGQSLEQPTLSVVIRKGGLLSKL